MPYQKKTERVVTGLPFRVFNSKPFCVPASYLIYQSKKIKVIVPLDYRSETVYLFIKEGKGSLPAYSEAAFFWTLIS